MMLRRLVAAIFLPRSPTPRGFIFLIIVGVLIVVGLLVGGIIYSLKGGGFHHNPEIPWGYSPKARTASTGKPKEVAVQKDTEAA